MSETERFQESLWAAFQQLLYWYDWKQSCPCGARPESLDTHPHVGGCPTAAALLWRREVDELERRRKLHEAKGATA